MCAQINPQINPLNDNKISSLFYCFLSPKDWTNLSLVSKSTNMGFKIFLNIVFGNVNTWSIDCPIYIHKWKCRYGINGPFEPIKPTMPLSYSDPKNSTLSILCRPKIKVI